MTPTPTSHVEDDTIQILHVDDDADFADMAATFLEREDDQLTVRTATSVADGREQLAEYEIDCLVSDYDMPGMNGIEFLQQIRDKWGDLPFILFTGKGSEEVASKAISAGVTDYLQKETGTGQYAVLANRIKNAVEQHHSQSALEASQKRLSLFFDQSPLGVIEWDENFDFVRLNDAAEEILGYSQEELAGRSWEVIVSESDTEPVDTVVSDLLANEGGYHSINENVRKDGERIICEWHNRVVTDEDGDTVAIFSQFQDITERKEREQQLRETTARIQALFENSPDMINIHDAEGNLIDPNPRLCDQTGYSEAELTEMKVWELDRAIDPDEATELWSEMDVGDTQRLEGEYQRHDGSTFPVQVHLRRLDLDGEDRFMAISHDITERKERQQELERERDRFESLFETLPEPAVLVSGEERLNSTIDRVNPAFEDVFGYDEDAIIGKHLNDVIVPENRLDEARQIDQSNVDGDLSPREVRRQTTAGELRDFLLLGTGVTESDTDRVSAFAIYADITDQKETERALERQQARFETLFETLPEPTVILSEGPFIKRVNSAFEDVFGYDGDTIQDENINELIVPSDDRDQAQQMDTDALDGKFLRQEVERQTADGERRHCLMLATGESVVAPDGTTEGFVIYADITEEHEQSQRLAALTDAFPDLAFIIDETGNHIEQLSNPANDPLLVSDRDEVIGADFYDLFPSELAEEFLSKVKQTIEGDRQQRFEYQLDLSEESRWFEAHLTPYPGKIDGNRAVVWVTRDITERKEREQALEIERDRFRTLFENLAQPIVEVEYEDKEPIIRELNPAFEDTFGYDRDRLLNAPLDEFVVPPEKEAEADDINERVLAGEHFEGLEVRRQTATGENDFLLQNALYSHKDGGFAIYNNITERKERERALYRERDRFTAIFETIPEPIVHVTFEDSEPKIETVNSAFTETFGYPLSEIKDESLNDVIVPPDKQDEAVLIDKQVRAGETLQREIQRMTADGIRDFLFRGMTFELDDGQIEGTGVYIDITAHKEHERELQRQNERLEQFASVLSHDLRNPLSIAEGNLELAQSECESEYLDAVGQAHERIRTLVDDLLTLAREGQPVTDIESIDLARLTEESWQNVMTDDVTLQIETEQQMMGDRTRLKRVFENLIRNAVEYGGDTVTVGSLKTGDGFYFEDNGPGIPEDERESVFESGYSTSESGTGFGLAIVNEIIEAHGWSIMITDSQTGGARFEISNVTT